MDDAELAGKIADADAGNTVTLPSGGEAAGAAAPPAVIDPWLEAAKHYGRLARTFPGFPDTAKSAWTDEALEAFGRELSKTAAAYGWTFGAHLNHPLVRLAGAGWPLAAPFLAPHIEKMMKKGKEPELAPETPPPAEAPKVQPPGAV